MFIEVRRFNGHDQAGDDKSRRCSRVICSSADESPELVMFPAELARAGDYDSAVRILATLNSGDPETLDLLAKVHAQRGDLIAAEAAWRRVLARDPADAAAQAGIQLITQINAGKRRRRPGGAS